MSLHPVSGPSTGRAPDFSLCPATPITSGLPQPGAVASRMHWSDFRVLSISSSRFTQQSRSPGPHCAVSTFRQLREHFCLGGRQKCTLWFGSHSSTTDLSRTFRASRGSSQGSWTPGFPSEPPGHRPSWMRGFGCSHPKHVKHHN